MFGIGDFARHGRVSVRMLRHYDAIGLLRPAHVDPGTGYRYYRAGQLADLNRIVALKDLGLHAGVGPGHPRGPDQRRGAARHAAPAAGRAGRGDRGGHGPAAPGGGTAPVDRERGHDDHRRRPDQDPSARTAGRADRGRRQLRPGRDHAGDPAALRRADGAPRAGRSSAGRAGGRPLRGGAGRPPAGPRRHHRRGRHRRPATTSPSPTCPASAARRPSSTRDRWTTCWRHTPRWPAGSTPTATGRSASRGSSPSNRRRTGARPG